MKTSLYTVALWIALPATVLAAAGNAQQHPHHHAAQDATPPATQQAARSPYADMQDRPIKALSRQQIADLRAGKGMSLALAAELNGYPGPAHVLELAVPLGLSEGQQRDTHTLFEQMQAEAKSLGESVIATEDELDRLFRDRSATAAAVQRATATAAQAHGRLRAAHLRYHLSMLQVLTPAQADTYRRLRGYQ